MKVTEDGRYTAKEIDAKFDEMYKRLVKMINQVIVTGRNGVMPEDSNPTSLLLSVEDDRDADNIAAFPPEPSPPEEIEVPDTPPSGESST